MTTEITLFGRSTSHYTRTARIFAIEAGARLQFESVPDMASVAPETYGGHPALKLPLLQVGAERLFGTENICRHLVDLRRHELRVAWPEMMKQTDLRNAQELIWHAMQAQVQLIIGIRLGGLSGENIYFAKARHGLKGALDWLDNALPGLLSQLPQRDLSLLETTLFCLVEHLKFRPSVDPSSYSNLLGFCVAFGERTSAEATPYVIGDVAGDLPPSS